jgi:CheY-like chemotaxis protein
LLLSTLRRLGVCAFVLLLARPSLVAAQDDKDDPEIQKKIAAKALLEKAETEYRLYFKKPDNAIEFWAAMKFEIHLGKFDLAALHLKLLLEKEPAEDVDKELLQIEEAEGFSTFMRLTTIRTWSDFPPFQKEAKENVDKLIDRVTKALDKHLGDPARIGKFIKNLDAPTIEERAFAFAQLNRSGERAVPYLVDAMRLNVGKPLYERLVDAMLRFDRTLVPPLLEVLKARDAKDAKDPDVRPTLLDILRQRDDDRALPYLWHLSAAPMYPGAVRSKAKKMLAQFLDTDQESLPPAHLALTDLAERYYQHKIKLRGPVRVWPWDGERLALKPVTLTPSQAEEFFGLRHAKEALELEPAYRPAQVVFLNLLLERTVGPELDQALLKKLSPSLQRLLASLDIELLMTVLDRSLEESNRPVAVAALEALGERGDAQAARPSIGGAPKGVAKGLFHPDRRVQFAAVKAMLRMPSSPTPPAAERVVELLRRFVAADTAAKALVAFVPADKAAEIRAAVKEAGFEPILVPGERKAFELLRQSADFDFVLLHHAALDADLPYVLTQLAKDRDAGSLPVLMLASKEKQERLTKLAAPFRNVVVVPEGVLAKPEDLKEVADKQVKDVAGAKLTDAERQGFMRIALDLLWRMARGEITGYDIRPATGAVVGVLRNKELAVEAIEILGRLPGPEPQNRLAGVVADPSKDKLRLTAALELNRHIQKYGLLLQPQQASDLRGAYLIPDLDNDLKTQLALVLSQLRPSAQATGRQLYNFRPDAPAPKDKEK